MTPIVNGLEREFDTIMAFQRFNANTDQGQSLLRAYELRGHPSYVVVDTRGKRLWSGMGEIPESILRTQVEKYSQ
ncbi:MAG: hypothetical protein AAF639_31965 [Chloroflexota bacterium]